jgi:hypothetical protein
MDEPQLTWRLGRWIARRGSGGARLTCSAGTFTLRLREGRLVSVDGIDPALLAVRLGVTGLGHADLLDEARALAAQGGAQEMEAVGGAKEMVEERLRGWFLDPDRQLELLDEVPEAVDGATISLTHAVVELVLNDPGRELASAILPDLKVLLRRSGSFIELYVPLRLSEDADLIVAKITGQRTAEEIATRSPHDSDEVVRLLAALVAAGMLEPVPVVTPTAEVELLPSSFPEVQPKRRRLRLGVILAAAVGVAAVLVVAALLLLKVLERTSAPPPARWGVVIDMGCQPQDLQRVLRRADQHPQTLRAVRVATSQDECCWRLVWGHFASSEEASAAIASIPTGMKRQGFDPHPIELDLEAEEPHTTSRQEQ